MSAATALWVDDALFWLGDDEESCFSEGVTLPAEDMALLDVAFQYLGIGTIPKEMGTPITARSATRV